MLFSKRRFFRFIFYIFSLITLLGLFPRASSAANNQDFPPDEIAMYGDESPQLEPRGTGKVEFGATVGLEYLGASRIDAYFYCYTLNKEICVSLTDYRERNLTLGLCCGEYEFVRINIPNARPELEVNTICTCTPSYFKVSEDGASDFYGPVKTVWLNVQYSQNLPAYGTVNISCVSRNAIPSVNMSVYEKTNSLSMYRQNEYENVLYRTFAVGEKSSARLRTGECKITSVDVYDSEHQPLNVYYPSNYFHVRPDDADGNTQNQECVLYAFRDESELPADVLHTVRAVGSGYVLKKASEMKPYFENKTEDITLDKDGSSLWGREIRSDEIPAGERGGTVTVTETEEESEAEETELIQESSPEVLETEESTDMETDSTSETDEKPEPQSPDSLSQALRESLVWALLFGILVGVPIWLIRRRRQ